MGYSHYIGFNKSEKSEKQFKTVLTDCTKIMANKGDIGIFGEDGTGEPTFSDDAIIFNGDDSKGLHCEPLFIIPKKSFKDFCKTERNPYDLIVCAVIISLANRLTGFTFTTDGDMGEWQEVLDFYELHVAKLSKVKKAKFIKWIKK
jgi:hypothetical protein